MVYKIGTRGSKLALIQADSVREKLEQAYKEHTFQIEVIKTKGDKIQHLPLNQIGDKGLFVREIEEQLLDDTVQIGVHSMKDMPSKPAEGLVFTKAWKREDSRDVLILREMNSLDELPEGATIGTGSKRREYQLKQLRSDLKVVDIRGNVDTRIRKMHEQKLDGIVLAAAGLHRLGMSDRITQYLDADEMICAPAQGVLALEVKSDHEELIQMLNSLSDEESQQTALAERTFLSEIGGDCHVPVGASCTKNEKSMLTLRAVFGTEDGKRMAKVLVKGENAEKLAKEAARQIRQEMAGTVYLIGAGPGDPELITIKGLRLLQEADCIVYDRLASPELLSCAKDGAELIYAGKENRHHTLRQEEINQLLVEKAMRYEKVVRLKGGDVYVFGRGGEEGLFLREQGVPFEIVPGISSCMAGLAYAGIPITHRGVAAGFQVVTAHNRFDELADIDFAQMSKSKDTLVFLMGLAKVREITAKLLEAGKPGNTGVAVISKATTPDQRTCVSDLAHLAEKIEGEQLASPALIVVGEVVNLREQLNFFEKKPLFGRKYLVPKIGRAPGRLASRLRELGADAKELTVGEIVYKEPAFSLEELKNADWLIFTSQNGVRAFLHALDKAGADVRALARMKVAAVGKETARVLKEAGICADFVPERYDSEALGMALKDVVKATDYVWYLKAEHAENELKHLLEDCCIFCEYDVYSNKEVAETALDMELISQYETVFFTCASSVERVIKLLGKVPEAWLKEKAVISIGPKCTEALQKAGICKAVQAEEASYQSMIESALKG